MTKSKLTEKVLSFQQSGRGRELLIHEIALLVYSSFLLKTSLSEDQTGEFLCFFYRDMDHLINRFSYQGKPFEAYLNIILKWRLKSFLSRTSRKKETVSIVNDARFINIIQQEYPVLEKEMIKVDPETAGMVQSITDKKRILILFMKEYVISDPEYLPHVALITGFPEKWIEVRAEMLKRMVYRRIRRYRTLSEKRNRTFFKLYLTEKKLSEAYTAEDISIYTSEITTLNNRLRLTNKELSRVSFHPTNREISMVTGIPKGTIDSGMFYLRKLLHDTSDRYGKAA